MFDLCATVAAHAVTSALQLLGLDDSSALDTFISACIVQRLLLQHQETVADGGSLQQLPSLMAGTDECPLSPTVLRNVLHAVLHGLHGLAVLTHALGSLACWCVVFSILNWVGGIKARAVASIVNKHWRQRVRRQHIGVRGEGGSGAGRTVTRVPS